jgi:16S rRNA (cytidine1402-2'-O)-methyltransferase
VGTLYVVGTPIGNLEDITLRALRILREVAVIAAEDTRHARTLLQAHDLHTPLTSFHDFTGPAKIRRLVERIEAGEDVALISDAGMPGISDPGYPLINAALAAGCEVTCIPGPSAILVALVLSGLPSHAFRYVGFLPRKPGERRNFLARLAEDPDTIICLESPHRLVATLCDVAATFGADRPIAVARELTKRFEEVLRSNAGEAIAHFEATAPRGEFTLVLAGRSHREPSRDDSEAHVPQLPSREARAPRARRG